MLHTKILAKMLAANGYNFTAALKLLQNKPEYSTITINGESYLKINGVWCHELEDIAIKPINRVYRLPNHAGVIAALTALAVLAWAVCLYWHIRIYPNMCKATMDASGLVLTLWVQSYVNRYVLKVKRLSTK